MSLIFFDQKRDGKRQKTIYATILCNTVQLLLSLRSSDCLYLTPVLVYDTITNKTEPKFDIMALLKKHQRSLAFDRLVICIDKVLLECLIPYGCRILYHD